MADLMAAIERGDFFETAASQAGAVAGCPFCRARAAEPPIAEQTFILLNGADAGDEFVVSGEAPAAIGSVYLAFPKYGHEKRLTEFRSDLYLAFPLSHSIDPDKMLLAPLWLPKLSVREAFIVDEIAVWFCNEGKIGDEFHWKDSRVASVAWCIWRKRLPIEESELSAIMLAHGMPGRFQADFERLFRFGMDCLIAANGRPPIKKKRLPDAISETFLNALRRNY